MTDPVAEKIKDKSDRGEYTLVAPVDYLILADLPDEGSLVLGVYPQGKTAIEVSRDVLRSALNPGQTSMRLRLMAIQSITTHQRGIGNGGAKVWQRTPLGKQLYEEWKEKSGDISS